MGCTVPGENGVPGIECRRHMGTVSVQTDPVPEKTESEDDGYEEKILYSASWRPGTGAYHGDNLSDRRDYGEVCYYGIGNRVGDGGEI